MRKQPGAESGRHSCMGMRPSVQAAGTYGARLVGPHRGLGNGGCCEVGKAAGELFDAAARDDQHGYVGRSLREVGHGSSRAAPGAPPPLKTPKSGGWDRPGFVVASPCLDHSMVAFETLLFSPPFREFRRPNRSNGWRRLAAPTARRGVLHMHGRLAQARSCSYRLGARTSVRPPSKAREVRWAERRTLAQVCYCRRP
jgi:hypothetical protein